MHDDIKRFEQEGYTENNAQNRDWCIRELETQMRDAGYAPSIDNEPQYTVEYLPAEECFKFKLSVFGVFVGKEDAWSVSGVTTGRRIMKHTPRTKSKAS